MWATKYCINIYSKFFFVENKELLIVFYDAKRKRFQLEWLLRQQKILRADV